MHPQLLTVVDKEVLKTWTSDEWAKWRIEPKLDGYRLIYHQGQFLSRTGKPFHNLEHIGKELAQFPNFTFDGELYGDKWEDAAAARRSKNSGVNDLKFCVFDMMPDSHWIDQDFGATFAQRRLYMEQVLSGKGLLHVRMPVQQKVDSYGAFLHHHLNNLAIGCDGTVLKREDSLYEFKRTRTWLKVKPVQTFDCRVVGIAPGKGKYSSVVGALTITVEDGPVYMQVSGMTDAQRKEWHQHPENIMGKFIEVEARGVHKSGKLIEPRFIRIREDK